MDWQKYLVWSNEHAMWWKPHRCGYTAVISEAGRYSFNDATVICEGANIAIPDGKEPNEVLVLAPECLARDEQ